MLDLPWLVSASPGHFYCQPQGKALDFRYSIVKVLKIYVFQLHYLTKRTLVKFQELACFRIGGGDYAGNIYCENVRTMARRRTRWEVDSCRRGEELGGESNAANRFRAYLCVRWG